MQRIDAPWTAEEVQSLNEYQTAGVGHPFTGDRKPNGEETVLIATSEGWVEVVGGPVVQTWAYEPMANGKWRDSAVYRLSKAAQSWKRAGVRVSPYEPYGLKPSDFKIGIHFWMSGKEWMCTDVGTRSIAAIRLDPEIMRIDSSWFKGPPYAVIERVLDETSDLTACSLEKPEDPD